MPFTAEMKRDAARREIRFRERVYNNKVRQGSMTQAKADFEIEIMREIAEDYERLAKQDRLL